MDPSLLLLCALVIFLEVTHLIERKDLYNRIMAKSLTEYSSHVETLKKAKVEVKDELVRI